VRSAKGVDSCGWIYLYSWELPINITSAEETYYSYAAIDSLEAKSVITNSYSEIIRMPFHHLYTGNRVKDIGVLQFD
jgi:hypothetical protein